MTPITTTKAKLLFVEVPDMAFNYFIDSDGDLLYSFPVGGVVRFLNQHKKLSPPGSTYKFLFTTKQATEEDWKGVVDRDDFEDKWKYRTYDIQPEEMYWYDTATESGLSLQQANGLDVNKNYAVIEVKN